VSLFREWLLLLPCVAQVRHSMSESRGIAYCRQRQVSTILLRVRFIAKNFGMWVGLNAKNVCIRNQDDYLRAHITVLRQDPQKSGAKAQLGNVTKSDSRRHLAVHEVRKPAKVTAIRIPKVLL
jgi:hypothetical protein